MCDYLAEHCMRNQSLQHNYSTIILHDCADHTLSEDTHVQLIKLIQLCTYNMY